MVTRLLRSIAHRMRVLTMTMAPLVALATTVVVSALGINALATGAAAVQSALRSASSAHELEAISSGIQSINGHLYHVLTLRGAQIEGFKAAEQLHPLLVESDQVADLLRQWSATRATPAQQQRVAELIAALERYKGAVDFVSQMLDVDFVAAVSFIQPFDKNFRDLKDAVDALVREVQARQRADAEAALEIADNAREVFAGVGVAAVLLALGAAVNMAWALVSSQRLARQNRALTRLTQLDALTGLGNRRSFEETLAAAWADCGQRRTPLTLVMFDIDHFKKFNDSQGHQAGDACLRQVAATLMISTRGETDKIMRYGGEEFAIILPDSSLVAGRAVAERVRQSVVRRALAHPAAGPPGIVTISLGVASLVPTADTNAAQLIEAADQALYAAKRSGRNRVVDANALALRDAAADTRQGALLALPDRGHGGGAAD